MTNDSMISPDDDVDLTSCDREPIHLLGAVQSFGFLIAVSTDWIVSRVSENAADTLGIATETLLGSSLDAVFDRDVIHRLRGLSQGLRGPDSVERTFGVPLVSGQGNFDIAMHQSGHLIVIEAEPSERDETRAAAAVKTMIGRLQATAGIDGLLREAARQVRLLTGFDRVMVYQFDRDGAGEVVAEVVAGGLDRYLGLKYPASDIPRQARALYLRNALRLIWDTTEPGSRIVPPRDPAGAPLDLSLSVLRAVSPIHLEYLTNMGVRASLSISIIVNGKLWGLFACHHMEPRRISLERRTAAELFGQVFSYLLESRQRDDAESYRDKAQLLHDGLMRAVAANGSTVDAILSQIDQLSDLVMADGVGVWIDGQVELHGKTPSMEEFTSLVRHLNQAPAGKIYATEQLSAFHPPAADYSDRVAGALAIPISRLPRDYLVFFRREFARSVTWAGNPDKPVSVGPNGTRLTPRKSFAAWQDTVRGQSIPWKSTEISIAESLRVTLLEVILRMKDESDRDRQSAQDRQELLIAELNHRVRNILGLIRGLVTQSQSRAGTVEDFATVIGGRIQALARAHDQVTTNNWGPGSLSELIRLEAVAYLNDQVTRMRASGPAILLEPQAFSTLALVLHELVTNAAKYGALSDTSGYVTIDWHLDTLDRLVIDWREHGGPAVQAPSRRGFGTTIIERSIPYELKGEARITYALTGVQARFVLPAASVSLGAPPAVTAPARTEAVQPRTSAALSGQALLVEDNMLIALDAEDMLMELGASSVTTSSSAADALRAIERNPPDFALLDVNLGDGTSIPVAQALSKRNIPFVFATGYGEGIPRPDDIADAPVLSKPYTLASLRDIFKDLLTNS